MRDSVFEGVLAELPVGSTNIRIDVYFQYIDDVGTHQGRETRKFPSKAEATFRRKVNDANDAIKSFDKDLKQAIGLIKGVEDRVHKRLTKLEKKNDSDTAGDADPTVA